MKIEKVKNTYVLTYLGKQHYLPLVSSVAFYKSSIFPQHLKWQVQDDASFLQGLLKSTEVTKQICESLLEMESFYLELNGNYSPTVTVDKKKTLRENRSASRKDVMSVGLKREFSVDEVETGKDAVVINSSPTIGEAVDQHKNMVGQKRNAFRKKST